LNNWKTNAAEREQGMTAVRIAIGENAFTNAYEEGKKMSLEEAVAFALEEG